MKHKFSNVSWTKQLKEMFLQSGKTGESLVKSSLLKMSGSGEAKGSEGQKESKPSGLSADPIKEEEEEDLSKVSGEIDMDPEGNSEFDGECADDECDNECETKKGSEVKKSSAEEAKKSSAEDAKKSSAEEAKKSSAEEAKKSSAEEAKKSSAEDAKKSSAEEAKKSSAEEAKKSSAEDAKKSSAEEAKKSSAEDAKKSSAQEPKQSGADLEDDNDSQKSADDGDADDPEDSGGSFKAGFLHRSILVGAFYRNGPVYYNAFLSDNKMYLNDPLFSDLCSRHN